MTPVKTYTMEEVENASPTQLIVIQYDEAIVALRNAVTAISKNEIESRCNMVVRATDFIAHLRDSLDMESGGEIAANLAVIYEHLIGQLVQVNLRNDPGIAADAISLLETLRESWVEVDRLNAMDALQVDVDAATTSASVSTQEAVASQAA